MNRFSLLAVSLLLLCSADDPRVLPWRTSPAPQPDVLAGVRVPLYPYMDASARAQTQGQSGNQTAAQAQGQSPDSANSKTAGPLKPASELALVRFVDGEFAHAVRSIPAGKEGLVLRPDKNFDNQALERALRIHGAAANPGDPVQITALKFKKSQIEVSINGGGRKKWNWRQHIDIGLIGLPAPTTSTTATDGSNGPEGVSTGCTVVIEFGRPVPDMTPDDLKAYLANVLDFSQQRSAAVQWVETLPPDVQKAITEKKPIVGMTREMVEAAIGKPDKKVRERNAEGDETEDWIYGQPPAITMFVTFVGEKVTRIKQFPKDTIAKN